MHKINQSTKTGIRWDGIFSSIILSYLKLMPQHCDIQNTLTLTLIDYGEHAVISLQCPLYSRSTFDLCWTNHRCSYSCFTHPFNANDFTSMEAEKVKLLNIIIIFFFTDYFLKTCSKVQFIFVMYFCFRNSPYEVRKIFKSVT